MRLHRSLILCLLILALLGSCGGGGGGGGGDAAPVIFAVRTMDPQNGSSNLPNDVSITVHLNSPVDPNTVGPQALFVRRAGSATVNDGIYTVSEDRLRVTFTPEPWYETSSTYELEVTASLRSSKGEQLAVLYHGAFQTSSWPSPMAVTQAQFREVFEGMKVGRSRHTVTLLPSGQVLIAGGFRTGDNVTNRAEVFDPDREDHTEVGALAQGRASHTASPLDNGLVLIAGGETSDGTVLSSTELYNWGSLDFRGGAAMTFARSVHTSTVLPDGRILVTGGYPLATAGNTGEIYDPLFDSWTPAANFMEEARWGHRATCLTEGPLAGKVLITGGYWSDTNPLRTVEVFDPATLRFRTLAGSLNRSRWRHSAIELPGGLVLISDGGDQWGELFNPANETFTLTGNPDSVIRYEACTFEFRPGEVLLLGGFQFVDNGLFLHGTVEQFIFDYGPLGKYFSRPSAVDGGVSLGDSRAYSAWCRLPSGKFFICGGLGPSFDGPDLNTALIFDPDDPRIP